MSRVISLSVAMFVLFLFYGFDIDNKIQQSDERITSLWATLEKDYQQRDMLLKQHKMPAEVIAAREKAILASDDPKAITLFIAAQKSLDKDINVWLLSVEQATTVASLQKQQIRIKQVQDAYDKAVDEYNLMVSKFPGYVFAARKGYEVRPLFSTHHQAKGRIPSITK